MLKYLVRLSVFEMITIVGYLIYLINDRRCINLHLIRINVLQTTVRPDFPITWTPIGIRVETAEADFSHQNLADFVNKITLPQVNVSVINIPELVEQVVI